MVTINNNNIVITALLVDILGKVPLRKHSSGSNFQSMLRDQAIVKKSLTQG